MSERYLLSPVIKLLADIKRIGTSSNHRIRLEQRWPRKGDHCRFPDLHLHSSWRNDNITRSRPRCASGPAIRSFARWYPKRTSDKKRMASAAARVIDKATKQDQSIIVNFDGTENIDMLVSFGRSLSLCLPHMAPMLHAEKPASMETPLSFPNEIFHPIIPFHISSYSSSVFESRRILAFYTVGQERVS